MGDILTLTSKLERAMRNRTGFTVTLDELDAMVEDDVIDSIFAAKLKRLKEQCPARQTNTRSDHTSSTTGGTGARRASGRSPAMTPPLDRPAIAALAREI